MTGLFTAYMPELCVSLILLSYIVLAGATTTAPVATTSPPTVPESVTTMYHHARSVSRSILLVEAANWSLVRCLPFSSEVDVTVQRHRPSNGLYAIKTVKTKSKASTKRDWVPMPQEALILLQHLQAKGRHCRYVIKLFDCLTYCHEPSVTWECRMQMEYCSGGDLHELMDRFQERRTDIPRAVVEHVFVSLIAALAFLHHEIDVVEERTMAYTTVADWRPVLHNGIKPANVLLRWKGEAGARRYPEVVLADFGHARLESESRGIEHGTESYHAPEMRAAWRRRQATGVDPAGLLVSTVKSDMYMLGVTIHQLTTFEKPNTDGKVVLSCDVSGGYGSVVDSCMMNCLQWAPVARPTAQTLVETEVTRATVESRDPRMVVEPKWTWG